MGKQARKLNSAAQAAVVASNATVAPAAPQAPIVYTVVAPKRPLTGTKWGGEFGQQTGNPATHAALAAAAAANGGTLTAAQALAVCVAQNHKGFYSYAINKLRILQPVAAAQ